MWVFVAWLAAFYAGWLALVGRLDLWAEAAAHWPIATAMAAGSYFAGSTPMGGGTVGFPVLVLLFDMPSSMGRNFSLAVQSIGMVSAAIYIFAARMRLAWRILAWGAGTSLVITPLAAALVAPQLPATFVAVSFAVIWCSFGILHFVRLGDIIRSSRVQTDDARLDRMIGVVVGAAGGIASAATGVGIDMMLYTALVALLRVDIKVAIPSSVVLMAFTSVIGLSANLALGTVGQDVFYNWIAAAPVVALGAPFGAIIVQYLSRSRTLLLVSALCVIQFVWTLIDKNIVGIPLVLSLGGVGAASLFFLWLYRVGDQLRGRPQPAPVAIRPRELLYDAATYDPLTGAVTKSRFEQELAQAYAASTRHARDISVVIVELCDLERVARQHGPLVRDRQIRAIGEIVRDEIREEDTVGRLGDHEFGLILPDSDTSGAEHVIERILERAAETPVAAEAPPALAAGVASRASARPTSATALLETARVSVGPCTPARARTEKRAG